MEWSNQFTTENDRPETCRNNLIRLQNNLIKLKWLQYLKYFFYVGINWNWKIAFIILQQEINGEKKYGIDTTGADELKQLKAEGINISHSTIYMPVTYKVIENAFDKLDLKNRNHFLDIGCGKGRGLAVAAYNGFNKITGVDFSKKFCNQATKNLAAVKRNIPAVNYSVIVADAAEFSIPDDVDCILLFNPFDNVIMQIVAENIDKSLRSHPREMNIIYANPLYKNLFLEKQFSEIHHSKSYEYFEVSVLSFRH
jgi:predicted RNA methylase